ncbi:MAG TPA: response regulator transcription factor [Bacteroidales bacterium]|jgi:DNA-binding response OmpR family regulator|nr:response regulator transcription factor [Bacteroidales bacterium]HOX74141.1 response regulator transcription factor [Bacteroidales bacterium]HPM87006.1 response regulator transcription factor [Bacteroidales bacterium]HQM68340.1 response regulator transcription factor [Bacteroidales bacterium]
MRILIVEDEPKVASFIKNGLGDNLYESDIAYDSVSAEKLFRQYKYDLIILDLIIPGTGGLELCKKLKSQRPNIPVLMLTALGTTEDKIEGFDAGANDYLVKPFEFRELIARVKVLLRTYDKTYESGSKLIAGDLELDLDRKTVKRGNLLISLTSKEFSLLEYFMRNPGRVLTRNEIAEKVWDVNYDFSTNVVDVYVNFLRKKIDKGFDKKYIRTRVGFGYVFED